MSEENVEIVLRAWEAWQQGEPWDEFLDPEFEWDLSARASLDFPVRGRGREDYVQLMETYRRAWIHYEMAPKELIDAGDNVVVLLHETTGARGTEALIEQDSYFVWTFREGKAVRLETFSTRDKALEAAGLSE
jgi:ketosteroid isomerase-like protein